MKLNFEELTKELKNKNIRLSHHRLKVLEFLNDNRIHPTADQIYIQLHKELPTLSKTTVYNSLNALIDVGLVKVVTIENNETRYDIVTDDHGHFKCESCGKIYDFKINLSNFLSEDLDEFRINNKDIYFKGICPDCIQQ